MENEELAKMIDHTFLGACGPREAIETLCAEARSVGFASVCVHPAEVAHAASLLDGSFVGVCTVVGFPLGQSTTDVKFREAADAVANGADELDFVVNQRLLKYDPAACRRELERLGRDFRVYAKETLGVRRPLVLKLILECCSLSKDEIRSGCLMAKDAGFDFVKTSTGFGAGGATVEDVALMRETVGPGFGVKAAGGIRDRATALRMIAAGADRLGTSAGMRLFSD